MFGSVAYDVAAEDVRVLSQGIDCPNCFLCYPIPGIKYSQRCYLRTYRIGNLPFFLVGDYFKQLAQFNENSMIIRQLCHCIMVVFS